MTEYFLSPQPEAADEDLDARLDRVASAPGSQPFADSRVAFVAELSRRILTDRAFREHPELMAMAHWFRQANINTLGSDFLDGQEGDKVFARRGVVFHIAPSNVDSVFIYSWLLSLLCGNANIARVSRRRSAQMQAFFAVAASLLQQEVFRPLRDANLVLSYDHDAGITERISSHCHLRVVWGGDHTIAGIRAVPLPPLAAELVFANRFSMAVLNSEAMLSLDAAAMAHLAQRFYNDAFWFNQQACSSPRVVIWTGTEAASTTARSKFWPALAEQVGLHRPENLPAQVMDRATTLFRVAHGHSDARAETQPGAMPSRIWIGRLNEVDRASHEGNGLFIETNIPDLASLNDLLSSRDQTIAHFGFDRNDWLALLPSLPPHAADRIVPVGNALTFSPVWDGVNLLRSFTREIQVTCSLTR
ncbi:hypothetical protein R69927_00138 [Paraburkholderia domus]|uniref:acyl-CoA reductase n=1 Tax=Paraburkholderia domus TaxID=2793075 RepID=UPI00191237E2|nr:acyl-CoA reductase [Paraburkholderia domus]MBK5084901.1 acyl-CoA reductase [Burkholderia sp. R-69927]CAE6810007.1 hypothetical protein R69927_00138 [Paraburkholderia domus]